MCKTNYQDTYSRTVAGRTTDYAAIESGSDHQKRIRNTYTFHSTHRKPTIVTTAAIEGGGKPTKVTTSYNTYGLPTSVRVEGTAYNGSNYAMADRLTTTTYSDNGTSASSAGYFIYSITNAKNHVTTTLTDPKHGLPTQVTDPNGQVLSLIHI